MQFKRSDWFTKSRSSAHIPHLSPIIVASELGKRQCDSVEAAEHRAVRGIVTIQKTSQASLEL